MHPPALDLEKLLSVPHIEPYSGFDLSPSGAQIAFSWNPTGRWEIYLAPLDGTTAPLQLTGGPGAKFGPRWSPDGSRLAYALDRDGSESYELYACHLATGVHASLTPNPPGALQPNFCWSPDSGQIAFISDHGGRFDTYVMPAGGDPSTARRVLGLPHPDWEVAWSPDGRHLAVVSETHGQDHGVLILPAGGGEVIQIAAGDQPLPAKDARWSPDGRRLAFASDQSGRFRVGIYELDTGRIVWPAGGEGDLEYPAWSPDGRLACVASQGPVTALLLLDLAARSATRHQIAPGVHYAPRFTPDGAHLIAVFGNPAHPCDLWQISLRDGSRRQLTHSLPPELTGAPFAMPERVRYPGLDGQIVPALLYRPSPSDDLPPAVVYVHGGPNWLTQVTWDPLVQHMVGRGWAVLAPNYRGSTGYGRAWQLANRFDLGGGDTQDLVAGADYLIRERVADPARIAVTGRSWGGYLTMTCLTQHPHRWAGGSAVVPFLNWFTAHANSREDLQHWDRENFGHPEENYDLWYERSPFFFLDRIAAPVQLICGAHDVRCPAGESIQARDQLAALGKECDLALYPDEGHSFLKIENVVDAEKRRVAFLARLLEGP
jgi:dipeptidyl aminopeptidase/acylaminoacyl peptidase